MEISGQKCLKSKLFLTEIGHFRCKKSVKIHRTVNFTTIVIKLSRHPATLIIVKQTETAKGR